MVIESRDTVGKISQELIQKEPESRDPIELQREMQKEYIDELIICANRFMVHCSNSFYVVVLTKNEKLLPNVFRNYFFATHACPTPTYDQSLFRYDKDSQSLHYMWTIPSKEACEHLKLNALQIVESERELLKFVMDFTDGSLDVLAKKLNKEHASSPLIEQ